MPQILVFETRLSTKNDEVELFKPMIDDSLDIGKTDFGCKLDYSVEILDTNDPAEVWRIIRFSHSFGGSYYVSGTVLAINDTIKSRIWPLPPGKFQFYGGERSQQAIPV